VKELVRKKERERVTVSSFSEEKRLEGLIFCTFLPFPHYFDTITFIEQLAQGRINKNSGIY